MLEASVNNVGVTELEKAIAERLRARELREAASLTISGYGPEIFALLTSILGEPTAADEAFAQFSEDLWRSIESFRCESSMRTWAYRLAWRAASRYRNEPFRRHGRRLETAELDALMADVRSRTAPFLQTENRSFIRRAREVLTPEEQLLLVLRVDRGLSWAEVAQVLADERKPDTRAALWKRFERIKQKLRAVLKAATPDEPAD